jgi:magnesium-protoporphyrin O-methyltransferase
MSGTTYHTRRGEVADYFDRTAMEAWAKLTSDVPVSGIRATVRAGRDRMRATLLSYLPNDLRGARVLDAGCGTGAFAVEAARRGAHVMAIDLSPKLVNLARERAPQDLGAGRIDFAVGDMKEAARQKFDYVVAMDSLIHYRAPDMVRVIGELAAHTRFGMVFTFAPRTPMLTAMHAVGRFFPRGDRAPSIEPVSRKALARRLLNEPMLDGWALGRGEQINSGFYMSHALEVTRA